MLGMRRSQMLSAFHAINNGKLDVLYHLVSRDYTMKEVAMVLPMAKVIFKSQTANDMVQIILIHNMSKSRVPFIEILSVVRCLFPSIDHLGLTKALIADSVRWITQVLEMANLNDKSLTRLVKDQMAQNILNNLRDLCVEDASDPQVWHDIQRSPDLSYLKTYREANFQKQDFSNPQVGLDYLLIKAKFEALYSFQGIDDFLKETTYVLQEYQLVREGLGLEIPTNDLSSLIQRVKEHSLSLGQRDKQWKHLLYYLDILLTATSDAPALDHRLAISMSIMTLLRYRELHYEEERLEKVLDLIKLVLKHRPKLESLKDAGFVPALISLIYTAVEFFGIRDRHADLVHAMCGCLRKMISMHAKKTEYQAVVDDLGISDIQLNSRPQATSLSHSHRSISTASSISSIIHNITFLVQAFDIDLLYCISDWSVIKLRDLLSDTLSHDSSKHAAVTHSLAAVITLTKTLIHHIDMRQAYGCRYLYFHRCRHNLLMAHGLVVSLIPVSRVQARLPGLMQNMVNRCFGRDKMVPCGDVEVC